MGDRETLRGLKDINLTLYNPDRTEGSFHMPLIESDGSVPTRLIGFHEILSYQGKDHSRYVHFYMSDIMFQRIWNRPYNYVNMLRQYDGMLSPDFSIYQDMPQALQIYNVYRNRLIGQYMQRQGIRVIPTVSWGGPNTFAFCFDGIEPGSVVSVASTGVVGNSSQQKVWREGMNELIRRKRPRTILFYGISLPFDAKGAEVLYFENGQVKRFQAMRRQMQQKPQDGTVMLPEMKPVAQA